jgi:hypothetical protein
MRGGGEVAENVRLGDPGQLGSEALDVVLLLLQRLGRQEHGEAGLVDVQSLNPLGEPLADDTPNVHGGRAQDEEAGNLLVVLDHLGLEDDLLVPRGEVLALLDGDANDVLGLLAANDGKGSLLRSLGSLLSSLLCLLLGLLQSALGGALGGSSGGGVGGSGGGRRLGLLSGIGHCFS